MEKLEQQTITEPEKSLANKVKQLKDAMEKLPADVRRKKDEKNWEIFFTILAFVAITGVAIFGSAGWLAVALTGTVLSIVIVGSGLVLSAVIGLSAWPLCSAYLWIRDLLSSEKIKAENRDYDKLARTINELKKLAAQQSQLDEKTEDKLQTYADNNFVTTKDSNDLRLETNPAKNLEIYSENNNFNKYGPMFSENPASANEEIFVSDLDHFPTLN